MSQEKKSCSQLQCMSKYLDSIPIGAESNGLVRKFRLINKELLVQHSIVHQLISKLDLLMMEIKVDDELCGGEYGTGSIQESNGYVTEEGERLIAEYIELVNENKSTIDSLLYWRDNSSDSICQLYDDIAFLPRFTFISHRWAKFNKALGLHYELLYMLSLAPEKYIWLDCTCSPQDDQSFRNGNCLKVIWNIAYLLDLATNVLTYYATDGVQRNSNTTNNWHEHNSTSGKSWNITYLQTDSSQANRILSDGLGLLFQYKTKYKSFQFISDLSCIDATGSARLWCSLERKLGSEKILNHSTKYIEHQSREFDELFEDGEESATRNAAEIAFQNNTACHRRSLISLDCYSVEDIEPVTAIMYQRHVLPMLFVKNLPVIPKTDIANSSKQNLTFIEDNNKNEYLCAIRLPLIVESFNGISGSNDSETYLHTRSFEIIHANGWYYNDTLANFSADACETFHINILWPQNKEIPVIHLQVHVQCLLEFKEEFWCYDCAEVSQQEYFDRRFDSNGPCEVIIEKCLFCILVE